MPGRHTIAASDKTEEDNLMGCRNIVKSFLKRSHILEGNATEVANLFIFIGNVKMTVEQQLIGIQTFDNQQGYLYIDEDGIYFTGWRGASNVRPRRFVDRTDFYVADYFTWRKKDLSS